MHGLIEVAVRSGERAADTVLRAGTTRLRSEIPDGDTGADVAAQRWAGSPRQVGAAIPPSWVSGS
jgi:hypothetical protein